MDRNEKATAVQRDRWQRLGQALILAGTLAVLVLTLGLSWLVQGSRRARERQAAAAQVSATAQSVRAATVRVAAGTPVPRVPVPISPENAGQVVELARWGRGSLNDYAWSADGRLLAVASSLGIYLYDARTLAELRLIDTGAWVEQVALSPDGELVASMSPAGLQLWRVADGTLFAQGKMPRTSTIPSLSFSPDGRMIVAVTEQAMWLCPVLGGELKPVLEWGGLDFAERVTSSSPWDIAFSPDGHMLALESDGDAVRFWETATGTLLGILEESGQPLDFSPDGRLLATGGLSGTVRLWSVPEGRLLYALETYTAPAELYVQAASLTFSPDGRALAAGFWDGTIRIWRTMDGSLVQTIVEGPPIAVTAVAFSSDGQALATASQKAVQLWSAADGALLASLEGSGRYAEDLSFSPDGQLLFAAGCEGHWQGRAFCDESAVMVWDAAAGRLIADLEGETMFVSALAFRPDGQVLAAGVCSRYTYALHLDDRFPVLRSHCQRGEVQPWNVMHGVRERVLPGYEAVSLEDAPPVQAVAFFPDGMALLSLSQGGVQRWRMAGDGVTRVGAWAPSYGGPLFLSPNAETVAVGAWYMDDNPTLRFWQTVEGVYSYTYTVPIFEAGLGAGAFSADGTILAYAWSDYAEYPVVGVDLVRTADGAPLCTLRDFGDHVDRIAFSPDARLIAVGFRVAIELWCLPECAELHTLDLAAECASEGTTCRVTDLAFSPDRTTLAAGVTVSTNQGRDSAVYLWSVEEGTLLATLQGHRWDVAALAFSPDGTLLATGSGDGTIRLWGVLP